MADQSIFSFLRRSIIGEEVYTLLDLDFDKKKDDSKDAVDDLSQLEITQVEEKTPKLELRQTYQPQIPIIGIGGAGLRLLDQIVRRVKSYGIDYSTMGIDLNKSDLDKFSSITNKYTIPGKDAGTAHQYRLAATKFIQSRDQIAIEIKAYFEDLHMSYDHEIVFLIMGSGGTGIGVGTEIARLLVEMGKRPVPFLVLPSRNEMTRIKFNAAVGLYYFNFGPKDRCLNLTTILIDNELFMEHNSRKYMSSVVSGINERIGATLGDILVTTELESHAYSADLNEFLEIFRDLKSVGLLWYTHANKPTYGLRELFDKDMHKSVSFDGDVLSATRSYFFISGKKDSILAKDYRELLNNFQNNDMFNKLYEVNSEEEFYALRGIFTGIGYTDQLQDFMQTAEDARVTILNKEIDSQEMGRPNQKIDRLQSDEEIDVKTGQELAEERAEEYAKKRREGDVA